MQHPTSDARPEDGWRPIAQDIAARRRQPHHPGSRIEPHSPVRDIMTRKVITFAQAVPIAEATQVLLSARISGAPVVDEAGRPVGIVSKTDLLEALHEQDKAATAPEREAAGNTVVGDIMVPYLLAAQDSSPISLAAALMAYEGVHRLLVLNEQQEMVGIVSTLDVLRWMAQLSGFCLPRDR